MLTRLLITDQRLAEMIRDLGETSFFYAEQCDRIRDALVELQDARELLVTIAAQSSGIPISTARSDCIASLAIAHLKNHGLPLPTLAKAQGSRNAET